MATESLQWSCIFEIVLKIWYLSERYIDILDGLKIAFIYNKLTGELGYLN
jgi:hypothetical protein